MVKVLIYLLKIYILFRKRGYRSINCEAIESLSIEIRNNESKSLIFNVVYAPPDGYIDVCKNCFKVTCMVDIKLFFYGLILL